MKIKMQGTIKSVQTKELYPDPDQPRQDFDTIEMDKLKESIEDRGIMTPITVEPKKDGKYLIIDGERRFRNAVILKLKNVPVNILERQLDAHERNIIRFQLQETHRQWTVFEKAAAMSSIKKELGLTTLQLARALAISQPTVSRYLSLLNFPVGLRRRFVEAKMPFTHLETLTVTKNLMPEILKKKFPNFLDICVDKYDSGIVTYSKDWKMINKLIKANKLSFVEKFFKVEKYSAHDAYFDSGLAKEYSGYSIDIKAKSLLKSLITIQQEEIELDTKTVEVLEKLNDNILENYV